MLMCEASFDHGEGLVDFCDEYFDQQHCVLTHEYTASPQTQKPAQYRQIILHQKILSLPLSHIHND